MEVVERERKERRERVRRRVNVENGFLMDSWILKNKKRNREKERERIVREREKNE